MKCIAHKLGVPLKIQGRRWYNPGCPMCEAKADADPSLRDAPTSSNLLVSLKRVKIDNDKFTKMWAGKHRDAASRTRYAC